jgi:surface antigen
LFDSGVPSCLGISEPPPRSCNATTESRHPKATSHGLAALAVAALVAGTGLQAMTEAPSASADASATVEAETQRMSDANLTSPQAGSYHPGDQLTLVCSARGQNVNGFFSSDIPGGWDNLWYQTSDGNFVADADIDTGTLNVVTPECSPPPQAASSEPAQAQVPYADRATGRTQGNNPGTDGQCTWGAAAKWFEASGTYPGVRGDALAWRDSAIAVGWTVVDDAQDRSIVVFQPGIAGAGGYGHVAWVDSVSERPDGRWIHVTEMNNSQLGGVGIFNDRDVKDVPGMSYILLP